MLDGALGTEARARRAPLGGGARLWVERLCLWAATSSKEVRGAAPRSAALGCGARRPDPPFGSIGARRPAYSPYQRNCRTAVCGAAARRLTDRASAAGDRPAGGTEGGRSPVPARARPNGFH